jgi:starch-binding outer membrane protein, SusD/RagB family
LMERGHELFYEGHRKIDLVRFNKYRRNCILYKGLTPTHQYMPLPNFAVQQAESYGKTLVQTFERPGFAQDI